MYTFASSTTAGKSFFQISAKTDIMAEQFNEQYETLG